MPLSDVDAGMDPVNNRVGTNPQTFEELVRCATVTDDLPDGFAPYRYQAQIAEDGFPDLIQVPTGSGKTMAAVLPWLWRRLCHPDQAIRQGTPRRLVLALPTRALIEQTTRTISGWLTNLGLSQEVRLHQLMGGGLANDPDPQAWRRDMHRPTIIVCTLDMLVSRMLLRAYGAYRGSYPIDFALMGNGAQIVVDEIQLVPQATATLRQVRAFQRKSGTFEPSGLTVMSATVDERILDTVDNPFSGEKAQVIGLPEADRQGGLAVRLAATRTVEQLLPAPPSAKELAQSVLSRHVPGSLTLVVVNTVDAAIDTYTQVTRIAPETPALLIHSRFRGVERKAHMARLLDDLAREGSDGGIVVTTQSIEAGVDIDARTLVTEAAPWSSIVQRAGRCNRAGRYAAGEARLCWFPSKADKHQPYDPSELAAVEAALGSLEGERVTSDRLAEVGRGLPQTDLPLRMLRWADFNRLFDTTADLAGNDLDIGIYIRPDQDLDLQLAWIGPEWEPSSKAIVPEEALRCPVGVGKATDFVKKASVVSWVFDPGRDAWVPATSRRLRPQDVVLVSAASGGYDPRLGFVAEKGTATVPLDGPERVQGEVLAPESGSASEEPGARANAWVELSTHLVEAGQHARALVDAIDPMDLDAALRRVVYAAAALHDLGKAHPDWQKALKAANQASSPPSGDTAYAKSPGRGVLRIHRGDVDGKALPRTGFRHELVSVFVLSTQQAGDYLSSIDVPPKWHPLTRYLVAAHHGHLRLSARDPKGDGRDGRTLLGCVDGEQIPAVRVGDRELPATQVDLGLFKAGRHDSWSSVAGGLLGQLGPFRLAYLETLVRMADWRASAQAPLAGGA